MKKICFLMDSVFSIGGVQRVTAVIAKELAKEADVTIVTFDKAADYNPEIYGLGDSAIRFRYFNYPPLSKLKRKICKTYSGIYRKLQPSSQWTSDLYARSSFPKELRDALTEELKEGRYDVIVGVHAPLAARLATIKKELSGTLLIGWIHNSFEALYSNTSLYIGPDRKRHYVYQFRKLDQVVVLCQHDADCYQNYDPAFRPKVIYNPLTLEPGSPANGDSKRFLAVGRFARKHKGFDLLIEAFHLFAQTNAEWHLDIVGEGVEEELYRALIKKYQLEERVTIHPFTNYIQDFYSKAQIYVLSSRWEGFGLVLVEALAHGLPIVSSDLPTSREIMGDFGLYYKNEDISELAEKLEEATRINWQQKSKEAIQIAKRFDVDNIVEQWKQIIEDQ